MNTNTEGSALSAFLVEMFLILIIASSSLKLISKTLHDSFHIIKYLELDSEVSRGISVLYGSTHRSPLLFGSPLHRWWDENNAPGYINKKINSLSYNASNNSESKFIEIVDLPSLILAQTNTSDTSLEFIGRVNPKYYSLINSNKWIFLNNKGVILINSKPSYKKFRDKDTLELHFSRFSPHYSLFKNNLAEYPLRSKDLKGIISPLRDHYILYVSNSKELRRTSLLTSENQPVASFITTIKEVENSSCELNGKQGKLKIKREFPCFKRNFNPFIFLDAINF